VKPGETYVLARPDAPAFFQIVAEHMRLVAPRRRFGGDAGFEVLERAGEIDWDYGHDPFPPKRYLLPPVETLFHYRADGRLELEPPKPPEPTALVGVRPCDVNALHLAGRFYSGPIRDALATERLERTVVFALACNRAPRRECFCICCDAGPWLESGFDVQMTDLGERFLMEVGSEKGASACAPGASLLRPPSEADFSSQARLRREADASFETTAYVAKAMTLISADEIPRAAWDNLAATCFRCGACTHLCPVCTCFTVYERPGGGGEISRCRSWDSCQLAGFTREASGHNPRDTQGRRLQRRMFHKVSYATVQRDGAPGCVGCGRCVAGCLTDLGLPAVLLGLRRSVGAGPRPRVRVAEKEPAC